MATVTVTRKGQTVEDVLVEVISTFGFRQYDRASRTDSDGEAHFEDNANRFYVEIHGRRITTVERLRGNIEVNLWLRTDKKPPASRGRFSISAYLPLPAERPVREVPPPPPPLRPPPKLERPPKPPRPPNSLELRPPENPGFTNPGGLT